LLLWLEALLLLWLDGLLERTELLLLLLGSESLEQLEGIESP
jgi:hypothetical protein